jgi:Putative Flp pilus-assembly TadE/G-like
MIRKSRLSKGQIAAILLIVMPVLLGVMGLGADISVLYYNWVALQKAADAAALAGASQLTGDTTTTNNSAVVSTATQYAKTNGITHASDTILVSPASDDKSVSIYLSRQVPYYFFQLIGLKSGKVTAKATAGVQPTTGICGAAPFGLPCKENCNGNGWGVSGAGRCNVRRSLRVQHVQSFRWDASPIEVGSERHRSSGKLGPPGTRR